MKKRARDKMTPWAPLVDPVWYHLLCPGRGRVLCEGQRKLESV